MQVFCRAKHKLNKGFDYTRLCEEGGALRFTPAPDMPAYAVNMFDLAVGIKIYCALFTDGDARLNLAVFGVGFSGSDIAWDCGDDVWMLNFLFRAESNDDAATLSRAMSAYATDFSGLGNRTIACFSRADGDVEYAVDTERYRKLWQELSGVRAVRISGEPKPNALYCLYTPERISKQGKASLAADISERYGLRCEKNALYSALDDVSIYDALRSAFAPKKTNRFVRFIKRIFCKKTR